MTESTANPTENVGTALLFENDRVRVWDLTLEPGQFLEKHIHCNDYLFFVVAGGSLRHVDPEHPDHNRDVHYDVHYKDNKVNSK